MNIIYNYWMMGGFLTVDSLGTVRKPVSLHKFAKNVDFFFDSTVFLPPL